MKINRRQAAIIVDKLIDDIYDRTGLGNEWEEIDLEIREEIRNKWIKLIMEEEIDE